MAGYVACERWIGLAVVVVADDPWRTKNLAGHSSAGDVERLLAR